MSSPGFRGEYEPVSGGHLDQAAFPYNGSSSTNNNSHPARYSNQPTYDIPVGGYIRVGKLIWTILSANKWGFACNFEILLQM